MPVFLRLLQNHILGNHNIPQKQLPRLRVEGVCLLFKAGKIPRRPIFQHGKRKHVRGGVDLPLGAVHLPNLLVCDHQKADLRLIGAPLIFQRLLDDYPCGFLRVKGQMGAALFHII